MSSLGYDWSSFLSLASPNPDVVDFMWATMLVTRASICANLISMVLGWPCVGLVVNSLLTTPFPFWPFLKPWPLLELMFMTNRIVILGKL